MENFIYYSELYNIYKCLFTDKQKSILELYYNENLSLSEISDIENVSKGSSYFEPFFMASSTTLVYSLTIFSLSLSENVSFLAYNL